MPKGKENKTTRPVKIERAKNVTDKMVAKVVGCGESTVAHIRLGNRNDDTRLGRRIKAAYELLADGTEFLLEEVMKRVSSIE